MWILNKLLLWLLKFLRRSVKMIEEMENSVGDWEENWDDMETNEPHAGASRHIILVRHGQCTKMGDDDLERQLTKLGREQAILTGHRLHTLKYPVKRFVHSTMRRARETAELMLEALDKDVEVVSCDFIREGSAIVPNPLRSQDKLERLQADRERLNKGFQKYFYRAPPDQLEDSYEVMVCHAKVVRYFVCRALQIPPKAWRRMIVNHASITWIEILPNGHVLLRCLGDCGHLAPEQLTTSYTQVMNFNNNRVKAFSNSCF